MAACFLAAGTFGAKAQDAGSLETLFDLTTTTGTTVPILSDFNIASLADFTLEVTGATAGTPVSVANGLITYTPTADGKVRFACSGGVIFVFENDTYTGTVTVDASKVTYINLYDYNDNPSANTGIYDPANLLQNPGFETIPNNVWKCYDHNFANIDITNLGTSGTSIRMTGSTIPNSGYGLLFHKTARFLTQSITAGRVKPSSFYKVVFKYACNSTGADQNGAVFRVDLGTTERGTNLVTTTTYTVQNSTSTYQFAESFQVPNTVDVNNPVWFTVERTANYNAQQQKLEWYDSFYMVEGSFANGISGAASAVYLAGTAYKPTSDVELQAHLLAFKELYATAQSISGNMNSSIWTALTSALSTYAALNELTNATVQPIDDEPILAATAALQTAVINANESKARYTAYYSTYGKMVTLLGTYKNALAAASLDASNTVEAIYTTANVAYTNKTIDGLLSEIIALQTNADAAFTTLGLNNVTDGLIANPTTTAATSGQANVPTGWTGVEKGNTYSTSGEYPGNANKTYLDSWATGTTLKFTVNQTVSLPAGSYILTGEARTSGDGSYIYVQAGNTYYKTEIFNFGNANGVIGGGWSKYYVAFTLDASTSVTLGITNNKDQRLGGEGNAWTGSWYSATNFTLLTSISNMYKVQYVNASTADEIGTSANPAPPTYANSAFVGWYSNPNLTDEVTLPLTLTQNTILYAKWTATDNNMLNGWDGHGDIGIGSEPSSFGWTATGVDWKPAPISDNYYEGYRDNTLITGKRVLSRRKLAGTIFAYPVTLTANKAYHFTGRVCAVNGTGISALAFNSAANNSANELAKVDISPANNASNGSLYDFVFTNTTTGTYYLTWDNAPAATYDRTAAWDLKLIEGSKVTYNTNGGTDITYSFVTNDETLSAPANPTKAGHAFAGWYSDISLLYPYTFGSTVSNNMTLYAKWEAAVTTTYNGTTDDWNNAVNWSSRVPLVCDEVIIPATATVTVPANVQAATVTIEYGAQVLGQGNLTGIAVKVKYNLSGAVNKWAMVTTPATNITVGNFGGDSQAYAQKMYFDNTATGASYGSKARWEYYTSANLSNPVGATNAFLLWIEGTPSNAVKTFSNVTLPDISSISHTIDLTSRFQFFGNPYLANIYLSKFGTANTNLKTDLYYVWDNDTHSFVTSSAPIAPWQAVIVERAEGTPSTNTVDFVYNDLTVAPVAPAPANLNNLLTLTVSNEAGSSSTIIRKRENGSATVGNADGSKLFAAAGSRPDIFTVKVDNQGNNRALVLNTINSDKVTVPVGIYTTAAGEIALTISGMDTYADAVTLIDGTNSIDLTDMVTYTHTATVSGSDANRFTLVLGAPVPTNENSIQHSKFKVQSLDGRIVIENAEIGSTVQVFDLAGRAVETRYATSLQITTDKLAAGVYMVKIGNQINKVIVK